MVTSSDGVLAASLHLGPHSWGTTEGTESSVYAGVGIPSSLTNLDRFPVGLEAIGVVVEQEGQGLVLLGLHVLLSVGKNILISLTLHGDLHFITPT